MKIILNGISDIINLDIRDRLDGFAYYSYILLAFAYILLAFAKVDKRSIRDDFGGDERVLEQ